MPPSKPARLEQHKPWFLNPEPKPRLMSTDWDEATCLLLRYLFGLPQHPSITSVGFGFGRWGFYSLGEKCSVKNWTLNPGSKRLDLEFGGWLQTCKGSAVAGTERFVGNFGIGRALAMRQPAVRCLDVGSQFNMKFEYVHTYTYTRKGYVWSLPNRPGVWSSCPVCVWHEVPLVRREIMDFNSGMRPSGSISILA